VEPEKQPLLGNGCVTRNNGVTVGSGVLCAVHAGAIQRGPSAIRGQFSDGSEKSRMLVRDGLQLTKTSARKQRNVHCFFVFSVLVVSL
jgi:hypothetical protein